MPFNQLFHAAARILPRIRHHPFNKGIAEGTLPKPVFDSYLLQSVILLPTFAKTKKLLADQVVDETHTKALRKISDEILDEAQGIQKNYLIRRPFSGKFFPPHAPTIIATVTANYESHVAASVKKGPEIGLASTLACFTIYKALGEEWSPPNGDLSRHPYHHWIASCSSPEFAASAKILIDIICQLGDSATTEVQEKMVKAYVKAHHLEYELFDYAYNCGIKNKLDHVTGQIIEQRMSLR